MEKRVYWLNFIRDDNQIVGCAMIEVDENDFNEHKMTEQFESDPFYNTDDKHWCGAAIAKSWRVGCNPGDCAVALLRVDTSSSFEENKNLYPYDTLLTEEQIAEKGKARRQIGTFNIDTGECLQTEELTTGSVWD